MQRHHGTPRPTDVMPSDGEDYADLELPDTIARQAQALAGADEPPRTLGEQSELFARTEAFQAQQAGDVEEMLVADDSRHAVHVGEDTTHTHCFLDALGIALLQEEPVQITTQPPGSDETIELTVSEDGVTGARPEMVVAYGFSTGLPTDVAELEELSPEQTLAAMHEHGCPTQNLFPDREAYEAWASDANAATMPMSLPQALAMVADYVEDWELASGKGEDTIDIRPSDGESYADVEVPEDLALRAWTLGAVEGKPDTLGDIVRAQASNDIFTPSNGDPEEMLVTDGSRHRVEMDGRTVNTYCFLDALILAFLEDTEIHITTTPPGSGTPLELSASPDRIHAPAGDLVVSFGVSTEVPSDPSVLEDRSESELLELGHQHGCPKINLFADEEAYQAWAGTEDAVTVPLSLPQAFALARDTVEAWGEADRVDIEPHEGDAYADRDLTPEITEILRLLTGLAGVERAPETLGDFAQLHGHMEAFSPAELGIEATLLAEDSRHRVELDDRTAHTNCILDALILGFLEDEPVQVATRPPGSDEVIDFTVSERGIRGGDAGMVVSFGFSNQLPSDPGALEGRSHDDVLAIAHEHGCPKINLFPDEDAYEAWASQADATTMPMSLPEALALARDTVRSWDLPPAEDGEGSKLPAEVTDLLPAEITQLYEHVDPEEFEPEELLIDDGDTRHLVHLEDGTVNTYCILDALIVGVQEEQPVEITTRPPGSDDAIEVTVSDEGIEAGPQEGIVSFGFSTQLPHDAAELGDIPQEEMLEIVHEHGCPTINLFPDEDAYEAWASQAEAESVSMSLEEALALARVITEITDD